MQKRGQKHILEGIAAYKKCDTLCSMLSGLLLLSKPPGCSSSHVTARVKRALRKLGLKTLKVGHIGTLDPFATGLLPVAVGQGTRLIPLIEDREKTYDFTLVWGTETTTGDIEGEPVETSLFRPLRHHIDEILPQFRGEIWQTPPRFSALKVNGQRAYDLARQGHVFELKKRPQIIFHLTCLESDLEKAVFRVRCNSGTYIRTLGQDIARALGTCGHLVRLERIQIGKWSLTDATPLDSFEEIGHDQACLHSLMIAPLELLDDIPALEVTVEEAQDLAKGRSLQRKEDLGSMVVCVRDGALVALVREKEGVLAPFKVFVTTKEEY